MRSMILVVAAVVGSVSGPHETPEHTVVGHTVSSLHYPRVQIRLPDDTRYVGEDSFVLAKPKLGDFDACELFVFANASEDGSLRKVYWVQFEQLLPKYPKLHYSYNSPHHTTIGGLDFYVDIEVSDGTRTPKPGSDGEHFYNLLTSQGYRRAPMMFVRLVHLSDSTERKELMIIAGQELPAGLTAEAVKKSGSQYAQWSASEKSLVAWAVHSIVINRHLPSSRD